MPDSTTHARPQRRLLPSTPSPSAGAQPGQTRDPWTADLPPARQAIAAACDACRRKKSKCSGERPVCGRCRDRKITCHYTTDASETRLQALKRKYDEETSHISRYEELFALLRSLPEYEARDILTRVRSGIDLETILNQVHAGDMLLELSVTPETRLRYEFPYISGMPAGLLTDNPYLESLIYESASLYSGNQQQGETLSPVDGLRTSEYQSPYLKPIHAAAVIEPRLSSLRPSLWTSVCPDDAFMVDLLAIFFRCEYNSQTPFQKDYFLEDMAAQKNTFCSSLLVNAVLAYGCTCYTQLHDRSEYWNPKSLSYRFLAEARRIWELEAEVPRLTTIQAAVVLNMVYNLCTLDKIGRAYSIQGVVLARRMKLLESSPEEEDERERNGRVFTAWMLYDFETHVAFHFKHPPMLEDPPAAALPSPSEGSRCHIFYARSCLRVIVNDICKGYFGDGSKITMEQADGFYARLKDWYESLPECLKPKYMVHPAHFQLHIEYQNLIMTLYEPFVHETGRIRIAENVISQPRKHFETLIRLYYLRHGFDATDVFWCQPLALAGFMCLGSIKDQMTWDDLEAARSMLFLAAKGLRDQSRSHNLAGALFLVIQGQMRPEEAALMSNIARIQNGKDLERVIQMQQVHSQWPVSVVTKSNNLEEHSLTRLVSQLPGSNSVSEGNTERADK